VSAPSQFDYYECTLTGVFDPEIVVQSLGGAGSARPGPAHLNYPASFTWDLASGGSVQIWYGASLEVHVVLSSGACDELVSVVRRRWAHRVSRSDVAKDYDFEGSFEELYKPLEKLGHEQRPNRVGSETVGDWLRAENGRTLYLGAKKSRWLCRIYEKGHEQRSKHPDQEFSLNWTRVEVQARPRGAADKEAMSRMSPDEVFASTRFGAAVLGHLDGTAHTPLPLKRVPSTDPLYWCVRQYGAELDLVVQTDPNVTVAALLAAVRARVAAS
jgi:hypothetical protein